MSGQAFTFIQVTDLHLSLGPTAYGEGQGDATTWRDDDGMHERIITTPEVLATLFRELAEHAPDFVIATGDLTNGGKVEQLEAWASVCAASPVPIIALPGNHDHHSDEVPSSDYERLVGERYFSFDHKGVHFAAIDWWAWRENEADRRVQRDWLAADLGALGEATPIVMLTHDQMGSDFYESLPAQPIASFSGHWHTTRSLRHLGTVHYNTANATFGGLDYSPAGYRIATWTGSHLDVRTVVRGPAALTGATMRGPGESGARVQRPAIVGARWARDLHGGVHLAAPVLADDRVLVATRDEDQPAGGVECFAAATGEPLWRLLQDCAVKAEPLVVGDAVVIANVAGGVTCVDLDGVSRWTVQVDDALRPWVYLRPASDGTRVFVGDVGHFVALDLATGAQLWARTDLGERENFTSFAHPVVAAGSLLVGFPGQQPALWGLDPVTGRTRWPGAERGRSIYSGPSEEIIVQLPQSVVSGFTPIPGTDDVILTRLGARVQRTSAVTGDLLWSTKCGGWFNPAAPTLYQDCVLAVEATGRLHCLGLSDGAHRWVTRITSASPIAAGPYRADGGVALGNATVLGSQALVPTAAGEIVVVSLDDGDVLSRFDVGSPVTSSLTIDPVLGLVFAATSLGTLLALELEAVLS